MRRRCGRGKGLVIFESWRVWRKLLADLSWPEVALNIIRSCLVTLSILILIIN